MQNNKSSIQLAVVLGPIPFDQAIRLVPKRIPLMSLDYFKNMFLVNGYSSASVSDINTIFDIVNEQSQGPYYPNRNIKTSIQIYFKGWTMKKVVGLMPRLKSCNVTVTTKEWVNFNDKSNLLLKNSDLDYDICLMLQRNLSKAEVHDIVKLMY